MDATNSSAMSEQWFYELNGSRVGPVPKDQLLSLLGSRVLARTSLVWRQGMADWVPLDGAGVSNAFTDTPPPLSGNAINNSIVWWLAVAPLLGAFAAGFLAGLTTVGVDKFWWTTLALNIGLSIADEKRLKKAGHDTSKMGQAWLVPVYLFKRAKILRQNNAYFIVWIVLFGLSLIDVF
jgi:hypothetical protein